MNFSDFNVMFADLKCIQTHWSITKVLHGEIKRIYSFQCKVCRSTCSIKLRTAMAGWGNPCEDVALCTPPEMGVRKRPDRLPLEFGVRGGAVVLPPTFMAPGLLFSLPSAFFTCTPQIQKQYLCQNRNSSDKLHTYIIPCDFTDKVHFVNTILHANDYQPPGPMILSALSSEYILHGTVSSLRYDECRRGGVSPLDWHSRSSLRWAWEAWTHHSLARPSSRLLVQYDWHQP